MAVTTENVQVIVTVDGKPAGKNLKQLNEEARALNKSLQTLSPNTEEFIRKAEQLRSVNTQIASIKNEFKGISTEMSKAGSGFAQFSGGVKQSISGLIPLGAAAVAAFAVDKVIAFAQGAVSAFNEAENAAFSLRNAIVNIKGESEETLNRLLEQADKLEASTFGFTAETIQNAQKTLSIYGLTGDEIEALTPRIVDYATATGKDLVSATNDVIAAFKGKQTALNSAGVAFEKGAVSVAEMENGLKKFEGSASSALDVGTNKAEIFSDMWGKVEETIGGFLADVGLRLLDVLFEIGAVFVGIYNDIQPFVSAIGSFIERMRTSYPILNTFIDILKSLAFPILYIPKVLASAAAGVTAFFQTANESWTALKQNAVKVFGDIGRLILTAFTSPMDLPKVLGELKNDFASAGTFLAESFGRNYENALKKYSISAPSQVEYKDSGSKKNFKQEEASKTEEKITKKQQEENVKRVENTRQTVDKQVQEEKKIVKEKEIDYQKLAQEENDRNRKLLEQYDIEEELANRVAKAKADLALVNAKTEDEILEAKIQQIQVASDIELQNVMLTAEEEQLIKAKKEADIAALEKEYRDRKLEAEEKTAARLKEIQDAQIQGLINLGQDGIQAIAEFSKIVSDSQIGDAERVKDQRLRKLEQEKRSGRITELQYAKQKEKIEADTQEKIRQYKRKAAETDKQVAIFQSLINTALAITSALTKDPTGILAAFVGAQGLLQTALIASKPIPEFAKGGIAKGPRHSAGGIKLVDSFTGKAVGEMEGGEPYMILSRNTYANNKDVVDRLLYNSMYKNGAKIYAAGGVIASTPVTSLPQAPSNSGPADFSRLEALLIQLIGEVRNQKTLLQAYITYDTLDEALNEIATTKNRANR